MSNAADRFKEARQASGLTQADLADALGVTHSAISQWETNLTLPDVNKLVSLSVILKRSIDWMLRGVDAAYVPPPVDGDETMARVRRLEYWAWGHASPSHLPDLDTFKAGA